MFKFLELKPTQKQYVITIMEKLKHTSPEISLSEIKDYHKQLIDSRSKGGEKLGYPNWLIVQDNKVKKSVYGLPVPSKQEAIDFKNGKNLEPQVNLDKFSKLFKQTVKEFNIKL